MFQPERKWQMSMHSDVFSTKWVVIDSLILVLNWRRFIMMLFLSLVKRTCKCLRSTLEETNRLDWITHLWVTEDGMWFNDAGRGRHWNVQEWSMSRKTSWLYLKVQPRRLYEPCFSMNNNLLLRSSQDFIADPGNPNFDGLLENEQQSCKVVTDHHGT